METSPSFFTDLGRFSATEDIVYNPTGSYKDLYLITRLDGPGRVWANINRIEAARYANKYVWFGNGYQNGYIYVDTTVWY